MNHNLWLARKTNVTRSLGLSLSLLLLTALATRATAQTILVDDFNDGNADGWTTIDLTAGRPYGPGRFDASSGGYHLEGGGTVDRPVPGNGLLISTWDKSSNQVFTDGFLRARVRAETEGTTVTLALRERPGNAYLFEGNSNPANPQFQFKIIENQRLTRSVRLPELPFGVDEDWNIEAGAVGDELSMKVWRSGDPIPESPQLKITDTSLTAGRFVVGANLDQDGPFPGPARVSATFDDVYFTFPEHDDVFTVPPYNIYLWEAPMPVPQVEGPFFTPGSPEKPDMRGDVTTVEDWPDLRITGQVTDPDGQPIPGLKLDFWQVDDQGNYDNSGGFDLRGHLSTDEDGNYQLWTVMPANYESIRTRHLHAKLGGENMGFESPIYTTQFYFPNPFDNDLDADGSSDKVIEGGVLTDLDAIALADDFITAADLDAVGASFADLAGNILTLNNDPLVDGYFDTTLNIMMPDVFQAPAVLGLPGDVDGDGSVAFADFLVLSANFGMDVDRYALGDLNGDGNVAFADFLILSDNFGRSSNVATVPEPASAALLGFAGLIIGLARRRQL